MEVRLSFSIHRSCISSLTLWIKASFVLICGVFRFFYSVTGLLLCCCFFFLRFQLLFSDFYHFHHVIWGMKWAKKLKTKNGQNMSSRPFSHDATHMLTMRLCRKCHFIQPCFAKGSSSQIKSQQIQSNLLGFYEEKNEELGEKPT